MPTQPPPLRVQFWDLQDGMLRVLVDNPRSPGFRHTRRQYHQIAQLVGQAATEMAADHNQITQLRTAMGRAEQAIDQLNSKLAATQSQLDAANARVATLSAEPKYDSADNTAIDAILGPEADPPAAMPTLSIAGGSVPAGTVPVTLPFTVTLSAASTSDVTATVATTDGTAVAGTDYTAPATTLTIPAGQTTATVDVTVPVPATPPTADKTFTLTLSAPVGATLGTATATGTIAAA